MLHWGAFGPFLAACNFFAFLSFLLSWESLWTPVFEHWKILELMCVFREDPRDSVSLLGDISVEGLPALPGMQMAAFSSVPPYLTLL